MSVRKRILIISLMVVVFASMQVVNVKAMAFLDKFPPYGDKWTNTSGGEAIATANITSGVLHIWTLAEVVGETSPSATAKLYKDVNVWEEISSIIIYYNYSAKGFIKAEGMALAGASLEIYVEDSVGNRMRTIPLFDEDAEFNEFIPIQKSEAWFDDPLSIPSAGVYRIGVCLSGYSSVQGVGVGLCDFLVEEGDGVQVSMTIYATGIVQHPENDEWTELMVGEPLTPYYSIEVPGWGWWWDYWNTLQSQVFINNVDAVVGALCVGTQVKYQTTPPPPHYLIFQLSTPLDITQWEAFRFYQILGSWSTGYCEFGFIDGSGKYATKTYQMGIGVWTPLMFDYTDLAGWTVDEGFDWTNVLKIGFWASCTMTYDSMLIDFPRFSRKVLNSPPNTPSLSGPTSGYVDATYTYSTSTTDPNGDNVRYEFDWGDGTTTTTGWHASGATASASHSWSSPATYNVKVRAQDSIGAWSGWSSSLAVIIEYHDVAVTSVTASPASARVGGPATITVGVENQGDYTETFDVIAYYDSTAIGTQTVSSLASGDSTTLTFTWDTAGVAEGTYTIKAVASTVAGETDTADNTYIDGTVQVYWVHDVAVTSVTASPASVRVGDPVTITVRVENQGDYAETFGVTAYYDGTTINTQTVTNLAAGDSKTLTFTWDTAGRSEERYTIKAVADTVPGETDTADNTYVDGAVDVYWIHDLAVTDVTTMLPYGATEIYPGWTINISHTTENCGDFDETFIAVLKLQCEPSWYYQKQQLANVSVGGSETVIFTWDTTGELVGDWNITGYTGWILVGGDWVQDDDSSNNKLYGGIVTIREPGDANGDGVVNRDDAVIFSAAYGSQYGDPSYDWRCDFDGDGDVDDNDASIIPLPDVAVTSVVPVLPYGATAAYPGWVIDVSVTVQNEGDYTETFNVTAYFDLVIPTPEQWETFWSMGDVNEDGYIDEIDGNLIEEHFGTSDPQYDINKDGVVNDDDWMIYMGHCGLDIWTYFGVPHIIDTKTVTGLAPSQTTTLTFVWTVPEPTWTPYPPNYVISGEADVVPGETDTSDNLVDGSVTVKHPGDVDGNGYVGSWDMTLLGAAYGSGPGDSNWNPDCDFNGDGYVGSWDLTILSANYGWYA